MHPTPCSLRARRTFLAGLTLHDHLTRDPGARVRLRPNDDQLEGMPEDLARELARLVDAHAGALVVLLLQARLLTLDEDHTLSAHAHAWSAIPHAGRLEQRLRATLEHVRTHQRLPRSLVAGLLTALGTHPLLGVVCADLTRGRLSSHTAYTTGEVRQVRTILRDVVSSWWRRSLALPSNQQLSVGALTRLLARDITQGRERMASLDRRSHHAILTRPEQRFDRAQLADVVRLDWLPLLELVGVAHLDPHGELLTLTTRRTPLESEGTRRRPTRGGGA